MCSPCHRSLHLLILIWSVVILQGCAEHPMMASSAEEPRRVIRICADPNNLPFSNDKEAGFENKIANLVAADLHAKVEYLWQSQRTGFFRGPLTENQFDLVLGVPLEPGRTTDAYYRSAYAFVSRKDDRLDIKSYDDPRLRSIKIGVQMVGDDYADTPPIYALARAGVTGNVVRISSRGDADFAKIFKAVADREIDMAIVWGPLAGYFVRDNPALRISIPNDDRPFGIPVAFSIAMRISKGDQSLRDEINRSLSRNRGAIRRILESYGVPTAASHDSP